MMRPRPAGWQAENAPNSCWWQHQPTTPAADGCRPIPPFAAHTCVAHRAAVLLLRLLRLLGRSPACCGGWQTTLGASSTTEAWRSAPRCRCGTVRGQMMGCTDAVRYGRHGGAVHAAGAAGQAAAEAHAACLDSSSADPGPHAGAAPWGMQPSPVHAAACGRACKRRRTWGRRCCCTCSWRCSPSADGAAHLPVRGRRPTTQHSDSAHSCTHRLAGAHGRAALRCVVSCCVVLCCAVSCRAGCARGRAERP